MSDSNPSDPPGLRPTMPICSRSHGSPSPVSEDSAWGEVQRLNMEQAWKRLKRVTRMCADFEHLQEFLEAGHHDDSVVTLCGLNNIDLNEREGRDKVWHLVKEYEHWCARARLYNANPRAPGHLQFKRLPVFKRNAARRMEDEVNRLLWAEPFEVSGYCFAMATYHQSFQENWISGTPMPQVNGDARLNLDQVHRLVYAHEKALNQSRV